MINSIYRNGVSNIMEDKFAFVVKLLYKVVTNEDVTSYEIQALENIATELPDVKENDFRW